MGLPQGFRRLSSNNVAPVRVAPRRMRLIAMSVKV
jgi:hypothetical protein